MIDSYPKGRITEKDTEEIEEGEENGRELSAKDAVAEIANMKKLAESGKCHPEENMTERELRYATIELTDAKEFIMSLIEEGELEGVKEQLELGVVTTMLASEYNIRGALNELPNKIEELIKRYTEAIKYFRDKSSE